MTIEPIRPASREDWLSFRQGTVGASEAAALLVGPDGKSAHQFLTAYELFMLKTGRIEKKRDEIRIEENSIHLPPMERGNFFEDRAFELTRMLRPDWTVEPNQIPGGVVFVDRETRISTTPDAFLTAPDRPGRGALQTKTVAPMIFGKDWKQDGQVEFPIYVQIQAIIDATLSGCEWACAGAMVSDFGVSYHLIDVPLHARLMTKLRKEVAAFWDRVARDDPPAPDFARDGTIIAELYADDDGGEVDLSGNARIAEILSLREALKEREADGSEAEKERKAIDKEILFTLGNATYGLLGDGRKICAKTRFVKEHMRAASQSRPITIKRA